MWIRVVSRWLYIPAWDCRCSATEIRIIKEMSVSLCLSIFLIYRTFKVSEQLLFGPYNLVGVYLSRQNEKNNPPPGHHIHTFIHDKVAISKVRIHYTKILVYQVGLSILIQVGLRGADNIAVPIEKSAMRPEAVMARADYLRDGPSFPIEQKKARQGRFCECLREIFRLGQFA